VGIFASQLAQLVRSSLLAYGSQVSAPDLRQLRGKNAQSKLKNDNTSR
jgi:hypothetical protein